MTSSYRVTVNGKEHQVELLARRGTEITFRVGGEIYSTDIQYITPALVSRSTASLPPGTTAPATPAPSPRISANANEIRSPMPGIVSEVKVAEGATVSPGDIVVIIEAMKMENPIRAAVGGKVKKVHVAKGAEVGGGVVLVELGEY